MAPTPALVPAFGQMTDPLDDLVAKVKALPQEDAIRLYLKLAKEDKQQAHVAALALRDKARAGELEEKVIPILEQCLGGAPDDRCLSHLAKALAAFGRKARGASPILADRLRELRITDDPTFWIFDGCLWSLGYLGGEAATKLLRELSAEIPNRALRAGNVYQGKMTKDQRQAQWDKTISGVTELLSKPDPGVWREKKTTLKGTRNKAATKNKPWTVR